MRPKDEDGKLLKPPHVRLPNVPALQQAALFKIAEDPRSCSLLVKRKLAIIDKAIDHCVDGDKVPKAIFEKDAFDDQNHFMVDMWRIAVKAVREEIGK